MNTYKIQEFLAREYANDSVDYSTKGLGIDCLDTVHSLKRYILASKRIAQEEKMELAKDLTNLANKLNELIENTED